MIRLETAFVSSVQGGLIALERAVARSKHGEYSAKSRQTSFEIPIRPALGLTQRVAAVVLARPSVRGALIAAGCVRGRTVHRVKWRFENMIFRTVALLLALVSFSPFVHAVALSPNDAGVYVVMGRDGQPTSLLYRFSFEAGTWRAEGKDEPGAWRSISCDSGCQYVASDKAQAQAYLPPAMRQTHLLACVQNVAQAFCKYVNKSNPSQGGYVVIALVTNPPTPILLRRQR